MDRTKALEMALGQIEKQFGKGSVMKMSEKGDMAIEAVSFTNPWTREMYLNELQNQEMSFIYAARDEAGGTIGFCSFWRISAFE